MQNTSHNEKATGPSWKAEFKGLRDAIWLIHEVESAEE